MRPPRLCQIAWKRLEEIGMEAAEDFEDKGGKHLHVIPCINDRDDWVNVLSRWIDEWALNESVS